MTTWTPTTTCTTAPGARWTPRPRGLASGARPRWSACMGTAPQRSRPWRPPCSWASTSTVTGSSPSTGRSFRSSSEPGRRAPSLHPLPFRFTESLLLCIFSGKFLLYWEISMSPKSQGVHLRAGYNMLATWSQQDVLLPTWKIFFWPKMIISYILGLVLMSLKLFSSLKSSFRDTAWFFAFFYFLLSCL